MAGDYNTYDVALSGTATLTKPSNTVEGDYILILATRFDSSSSADPSSGPSGFGAHLAKRVGSGADYVLQWVYGKIAGSSEPSSYDITWTSGNQRTSACIIRIPAGTFDPISPIDTISNDEYITGDTTMRAGAVSISNNSSIVAFLGSVRSTSSVTITDPSGFSGGVQWGSTDSDLWSTICFDTLDSGSNGPFDATLSASFSIYKHSFAVVFNPYVEPAYRFLGTMRRFSIFNTVLNAHEIKALHNRARLNN